MVAKISVMVGVRLMHALLRREASIVALEGSVTVWAGCTFSQLWRCTKSSETRVV